MAKINIYVADELKERMDAVGDVNWSNVARPAFLTALATLTHRRTPNMASAIERLRASKAKSEAQDELAGKAEGRSWAQSSAEYDDLRQLADLQEGDIDAAPFECLIEAIDPEKEMTHDERIENLFGDPNASTLSDTYIAAFIRGAVEFYEEVKDQL